MLMNNALSVGVVDQMVMQSDLDCRVWFDETETNPKPNAVRILSLTMKGGEQAKITFHLSDEEAARIYALQQAAKAE